MNKPIFAVAIGTAIIATAAGAQSPEHGGPQQQDMTRQQAQQMADQLFQRFDLNHDGTLTRQEADQATSQAGDDGGRGRGGHMIDRAFGDAQSLTQAQFEAAALARFDRQDLNHDGTVTSAERQQARAQRGGGAGPGQ